MKQDLILALILLSIGIISVFIVNSITGYVVRVDHVIVGDEVLINYAIWYNGSGNWTLYSTNIPSIAFKNNFLIEDYQPIKVKIGSGNFIIGLQKSLLGMKMGENKTIILPPKEAYGDLKKDLIKFIPISMLPNNVKKGDKITLKDSAVEGEVLGILNNTAIVNFNHPLAGNYVKIYYEILKIER